jgi:hypothetical protein
MQIAPGAAIPSSRAAMFAPSPINSPSLSMLGLDPHGDDLAS